ncbi:MAG: hypothetical protein AAB539_04465 [Patescibacteria group bacterium]
MVKTLINIKADVVVKRQAQRKAKALGLPLSAIVNAYLKEFVREPSVTFSVNQPQLRPEVERLLARAGKDFEAKRHIAGPFSSGEEMDAYLDAP